jgi:DNA-binding HxlR family transcriptional regulator
LDDVHPVRLEDHGPTRFGELKRRVTGVSAKVLTGRLRLLEQADIIERHYEPTIPPQVTYNLSARGRELAGVIDRLDAIAIRWKEEDAARKPQADKAPPLKARARAQTIATPSP